MDAEKTSIDEKVDYLGNLPATQQNTGMNRAQRRALAATWVKLQAKKKKTAKRRNAGGQSS